MNTPSQKLRAAYDILEALSVENDDAGDALGPVLAMLEDRHAQIIGAFEDEYGRSRDQLAEHIAAMIESRGNDISKERRHYG